MHIIMHITVSHSSVICVHVKINMLIDNILKNYLINLLFQTVTIQKLDPDDHYSPAKRRCGSQKNWYFKVGQTDMLFC